MLALLLCACCLPCAAQLFRAPDLLPKEVTVSGTVINALTGEPVARALVSIGQYQGFSDLHGHFEIHNVQESQASVQVRKPGFTSDNDLHQSNALPIQISEQMEPVVLKLFPNSVITGRIVDENGEPLDRVRLSLTTQTIRDGRGVWIPGESTESDEDGSFRFGGLRPGTYYLQTNYVVVRPVGPGETGPQRSGYAPTFYPGTPAREEATTISMAPGERREVLFKLPRPQALYDVVGVVHGMPPEARVRAELPSNVVSVNPATGRFVFHNVPAGTYELIVESNRSNNTDPVFYTENALTVSHDITNLVVAPLPAASIEIMATAVADDPNNKLPERVTDLILQARLRSFEFRPTGFPLHDYWSGNAQNPRVLKDVVPGKYSVRIDAIAPWYVAAAHCGSSDLLREPLTVVGGKPMPPIEVVLRDDSASVSVNLPANEEVNSATFLLVPQDENPDGMMSTRFGGFSSRSGSQSRVSQLFSGIAPGEYTLYAFDDIGGLEYQNPGVLQKYVASAEHITLLPRQKAIVSVSLIKRSQ